MLFKVPFPGKTRSVSLTIPPQMVMQLTLGYHLLGVKSLHEWYPASELWQPVLRMFSLTQSLTGGGERAGGGRGARETRPGGSRIPAVESHAFFLHWKFFFLPVTVTHSPSIC